MFKKLLKILMMPLKYLENPLINGTLKIFLIIYAATIAPKLPNFLVKLFKNPVIKMIVLFLISYTGIKDPVMSLMIAVAFTLTMLSLNKLETLGDVHDLLDAVIDVPQELLNDLVDGTQDIVSEVADKVDDVTGLVGIKLAKPVADITNGVVDVAQNLSNKIIDTTQDVVSDVVGLVIPKKEEKEEKEEEKEKFSMKDPNAKDFEMGSLGNIQGADDNDVKEEVF